MEKKGFSLIELLVSISIISILVVSAFAVLRPLDYIKRSRDSRRQSDLKVIQTALEQYYANNSAYPVSDSVPFGLTSGWLPYLRLVPNDPGGSTPYCYKVPVAETYELCAQVETFSGTVGTSAGCTGAYNYCLSNPF